MIISTSSTCPALFHQQNSPKHFPFESKVGEMGDGNCNTLLQSNQVPLFKWGCRFFTLVLRQVKLWYHLQQSSACYGLIMSTNTSSQVRYSGFWTAASACCWKYVIDLMLLTTNGSCNGKDLQLYSSYQDVTFREQKYAAISARYKILRSLDVAHNKAICN